MYGYDHNNTFFYVLWLFTLIFVVLECLGIKAFRLNALIGIDQGQFYCRIIEHVYTLSILTSLTDE